MASDTSESTTSPPTIYVIRFHQKTSIEAIKWLIEKIEEGSQERGASLILQYEQQKEEQGVVVHVSAKKIHTSTTWRSAGLVEDFQVREVSELTGAQQEYCVRYELTAVRQVKEGHVPGHPKVLLHPGQSLVNRYVKKKLIEDMYPLHDQNELKIIEKKWYRSIFSIKTPEDVQKYFGESVAMYFSFVEFYTLMLCLPALLSLMHFATSVDTLTEYILFAIFNLVWVTMFLEMWRRRSASLAFDWGTLGRSIDEEVQPLYHGEIQQNPVTGRYEPFYPHWKTQLKVLSSSLVVLIGTFCALWLGIFGEKQLNTSLTLMLAEESEVPEVVTEEDEDIMEENLGEAGAIIAEESIAPVILAYAPSIIYTIVVNILNVQWRKLSKFLTKWENHRMQGDYDWHCISKMIIFEFVNNFSSLFYIAFFIQDLDMLRSHLATMLIVSQLINQATESLLPFIINQATWRITKKKQMRPSESPTLDDVNFLDAEADYQRIKQAMKEADRLPFDDAFDDYLEMFMQFGYVCLFSSAYPFAAAWALLNNLLELRSDAFKLCRIQQRPQIKRASSIGVWEGAFALLGSVGVATNCALLCICPRLRSVAPETSELEWALIFVILEHIIHGMKMALSYVIPDKPFRVRQGLEKINYQSRLALTKKLVTQGKKDL